MRFATVLLFLLLTVAGCQLERTPEQELDHILTSPRFTVWLDNMHLSWSIRVEPNGAERVVNVWREAEPYADFAPVPYTAEHEALIRQIVVEAVIDSESDEFDVIRWGLEGGGETIVLDRVSPRLDSLNLKLINLGR
jgi:hypothetical protein